MEIWLNMQTKVIKWHLDRLKTDFKVSRLIDRFFFCFDIAHSFATPPF